MGAFIGTPAEARATGEASAVAMAASVGPPMPMPAKIRNLGTPPALAALPEAPEKRAAPTDPLPPKVSAPTPDAQLRA